MKKLVFLISFLFFSYFTFAQGGYGGVIYDKNASLAAIRPYLFVKLDERYISDKMTYSPIIGTGMNTLGNISAQIGFDLYQSISNNDETRLLAGFGVELIGWQEVYQDYMPSLRFGLDTKRFVLLATSNYIFKPMMIEGVKAYEPNIKPTIGLFYKISR